MELKECVDTIVKRIQRYNINWYEIIYLAMFAAYVLVEYISSTTLDYELIFDNYGLIIYDTLLALVIAGMAFGNDMTKGKAVFIGAVVGLSMYSTIYNGDAKVVDLVLFCIGARNVSFKKIAYVYLCVAVQIQVLALVLSYMGITINYVYVQEGRGSRSSLGIGYPTDCAAHILIIVMVYVYLRWKKITYAELVGIMALAVVVYKYTRARNNVLCIFILCIMVAAYKLLEHFKIRPEKLKIVKYMPYIMLVLAAIMIIMSLLYNEDSAIWNKINSLLSNRLIMGHKGFTEYGVSFYGQGITENGFGFGTILTNREYFFLDSSYVSILIKKGVYIFALVMAANIYIGKRLIKEKKQFGLIIITVLAISSFMEHHLMELTYNPFILMTFSILADSRKERSVTV